MRTRKALADALRERQRRIPRDELFAVLGSDQALKAWETGLDSKSDDEIIMSYFTCPDCGDTTLTLTDVDAVLGNDPDTVDEFLNFAEALERAKRLVS